MKSYKARLKQAGLLKNITLKSPEDIEAALQVLAHAQAAPRQAGSTARPDAAAATTTTTTTTTTIITTSGAKTAGVRLANGHVVSFKRLAVHLRRKRMLVDHHAGHYGASSPWASSHLGAPGPWRTVEQIFAKSWEYKSRRLKDDPHGGGGGGGRTQDPPVVAAAAREAIGHTPWFETIMYARDLLRQGRFADAVALLRLAPAQLTQMLRAEPPATLDLLLGVIVTLISAPPAGRRRADTGGSQVARPVPGRGECGDGPGEPGLADRRRLALPVEHRRRQFVVRNSHPGSEAYAGPRGCGS